MSFFEQIADMPQNRDCLSRDGVKGKKEKKDAKKAWEREEGGNRHRKMDRRV